MSEAETKKSEGLSRRDFLRLMGAAGTGLAFAPFIPFGDYMPNPNQASLEKVPVILPDGSHANLNSYEINSAQVITYPATEMLHLMQKHFVNGNLLDFLKNLVVEKVMQQAFVHTV